MSFQTCNYLTIKFKTAATTCKYWYLILITSSQFNSMSPLGVHMTVKCQQTLKNNRHKSPLHCMHKNSRTAGQNYSSFFFHNEISDYLFTFSQNSRGALTDVSPPQLTLILLLLMGPSFLDWGRNKRKYIKCLSISPECFIIFFMNSTTVMWSAVTAGAFYNKALTEENRRDNDWPRSAIV